MNYKIVPLALLNNDQINQLARLHYTVMDSLLSDLGLPLVERYYQIARADASVIGICALGADGHPLGWAVGSPNPNQVNRRMSEARVWFIVQMVRAVVTRPSSILQLVASARTSSLQMKAGAVELTYIGVDESARKQGVGRALLNSFIEAAREKKFTSVALSVEAENTDAIALYTHTGFKITHSFTEGRFNRHRMELTLQ